MLGLVGFTATCQQEKELTTRMAGSDARLPFCSPALQTRTGTAEVAEAA